MDSFSNDWEQVKAYIRDLELLLTDDAAELQSLDELKRIRLDLRALILGREQDARRVIQGALSDSHIFAPVTIGIGGNGLLLVDCHWLLTHPLTAAAAARPLRLVIQK